MKLLILLFLVAICIQCCNCQLEMPTAEEIEEILDDPQKVTEVVDCVIEFDPDTCDPRLRNAFDLIPDDLIAGGNCESCSEMRHFIRKLQWRYRKEFRRLLRNIVARK